MLVWEIFAGRAAPEGALGRVHDLVDAIDPDVDDTIADALSCRFASVGEFRDALSAVLANRVADPQEVIRELGGMAPLPPIESHDAMPQVAADHAVPPVAVGPMIGPPAALPPKPPNPVERFPKAPQPIVLLIAALEFATDGLASGLREEGFDIVLAHNAARALDTIREVLPACVVCDVELPDSDGDAVVRQLRKLTGPISATPFLLLASPASTRVRMARFASGADVCVQKPCAERDIVAQVVALYRMTSRLRDARSTLSQFPEATSRVFQGDLKRISLAGIITLVDMERRSGVLQVRNQSTDIELTIVAGHATHGAMAGRPVVPLMAMSAMLNCGGGRFSFVSKAPREIPGDACRVSALLTEATRLMDEDAAREVRSTEDVRHGPR